MPQAFLHSNWPLKFRLNLDQFRQTFNPELDVAKEFCRKILRPQLALAQKFPLFWRRVRPPIPAHDSPYLQRLFRGHFPDLPLAEGQILTSNDTPKVLWSSKVPTPGFRVAVKMHHGNDQNFIPLDSVNDSIGKAVCPATANLFAQREPCLRMHENAADCGTDFL